MRLIGLPRGSATPGNGADDRVDASFPRHREDHRNGAVVPVGSDDQRRATDAPDAGTVPATPRAAMVSGPTALGLTGALSADSATIRAPTFLRTRAPQRRAPPPIYG